jgi:hypothetical protein
MVRDVQFLRCLKDDKQCSRCPRVVPGRVWFCDNFFLAADMARRGHQGNAIASAARLLRRTERASGAKVSVSLCMAANLEGRSPRC